MLYVNPVEARMPQGPPDPNATGARAKAAFKELEQFFIYQMLREMRDTVEDGGLFERSPAMEQYEDLMDDALATNMAESGQFGIAKLMEEQLRVQQMQADLLAQVHEKRAKELAARAVQQTEGLADNSIDKAPR